MSNQTSSVTSYEQNGNTFFELRSGESVARVSTLGGQLIAWKKEGKDILFTNPAAIFDGSKPIRAGAPICFPWFHKGQGLEAGELSPQHGNARKVIWNFIGKGTQSDSASLTLAIECNGYENRALLIQATYLLKSESCTLDFEVSCQSEIPTAFTLAAHTYFATAYPAAVSITGLLVDGKSTQLLPKPPIDKIFENASAAIAVRAEDCDLVIQNTEFERTVVWNPGADSGIADLPAESGAPHFICVESLTAKKSVTNKASWHGVIEYLAKK